MLSSVLIRSTIFLERVTGYSFLLKVEKLTDLAINFVVHDGFFVSLSFIIATLLLDITFTAE